MLFMWKHVQTELDSIWLTALETALASLKLPMMHISNFAADKHYVQTGINLADIIVSEGIYHMPEQ